MDLLLTSTKLRCRLEYRHFPNGTTPVQTELLDEVQELLSLAYQAGKSDSADVAKHAYLGYMVSAAERIKLDTDTIERLISFMCLQQDKLSLEEAATHYKQSEYYSGKKG